MNDDPWTTDKPYPGWVAASDTIRRMDIPTELWVDLQVEEVFTSDPSELEDEYIWEDVYYLDERAVRTAVFGKEMVSNIWG